MTGDYIFLAILVATGWFGARSGRNRARIQSAIALILLNLLAVGSGLLLLPLSEGLLSPTEAVIRDLFDMSLYIAGLPLLLLPLALGASWVVGFAIGQIGRRNAT